MPIFMRSADAHGTTAKPFDSGLGVENLIRAVHILQAPLERLMD